MSQGQLVKDGLPGGFAVVSSLLEARDGVSSLGVVHHDLLGVCVVPAAGQVNVVQEEVIDSSLDHLEGGWGGMYNGICTHSDQRLWESHTRKLALMAVHTAYCT